MGCTAAPLGSAMRPPYCTPFGIGRRIAQRARNARIPSTTSSQAVSLPWRLAPDGICRRRSRGRRICTPQQRSLHSRNRSPLATWPRSSSSSSRDTAYSLWPRRLRSHSPWPLLPSPPLRYPSVHSPCPRQPSSPAYGALDPVSATPPAKQRTLSISVPQSNAAI